MLRSYWKVACRNLLRNRGYALINTLGLGVAIAFTLLIGAYVWGEVQVNRRLRNADRQYILQSRWKEHSMGQTLTTSGMLANELRRQYPNLVRNYYRWDGVSSTVSRGDRHFREALLIGDSTFLEMYGFSALHGDAGTALREPYSLVITAEKARKYFGRTDVVGQELEMENFAGGRHAFTVTAVLDSIPLNSVVHLTGEVESGFFLPMAAAKAFFGRNPDDWNNTSIAGYVELQPGVSPSALDQPMKALIKAHTALQIAENLTPYLVALPDYYLQANDGLVARTVRTLSFTAFFILLMGGVNFVNLSIGNSATRLKEIGVRKVMGGLRSQLVGQFLFESILLSLAATLVALALYVLLRPLAGDVLGKELLPLKSFPWLFALLPLGLALLLGLLAGLYPALLLSALPSIESLKGKMRSVQEGLWVRKALIAFQFSTAAVAFIGAILVSRQVNLFFSQGLGYEKDRVVYAPLPRDWTPEGVARMETYRAEFDRLPGVASASLSYEVPNGNNQGTGQFFKAGGNAEQSVSARILSTDERFAQTFGIQMAAGTYFTDPFRVADTANIVINETHARALGWKTPAEALGQKIYPTWAPLPLTICGVMKDFHFSSMQEAISPVLVFNVRYNPLYRYMAFKLRPGPLEERLSEVGKLWKHLMPGAPFEYVFMDETLANLYRTEIRLKRAAQVATGLAIGIVLLGVLGLISLSLQRREKEIGVRKVLGASVPAIVTLFMNEFLRIVLMAGVVACPVVYLLVKGWLEGYAYRIEITPWPFAIAIVALTALTATLISLQTVRVAMANPIKSLRDE